MNFYMIFIKIRQNSSNHRNMFEVVPENNPYNLKQPPPPIVPLPLFVKAVKLGLELKNRKIALKGRHFLSSRLPPQSKNLG